MLACKQSRAGTYDGVFNGIDWTPVNIMLVKAANQIEEFDNTDSETISVQSQSTE